MKTHTVKSILGLIEELPEVGWRVKKKHGSVRFRSESWPKDCCPVSALFAQSLITSNATNKKITCRNFESDELRKFRREIGLPDEIYEMITRATDKIIMDIQLAILRIRLLHTFGLEQDHELTVSVERKGWRTNELARIRRELRKAGWKPTVKN